MVTCSIFVQSLFVNTRTVAFRKCVSFPSPVGEDMRKFCELLVR